MGNRNRAIVVCRMMILLSFAASGVRAQSPRQPRAGGDAWYEVMLKHFNPSNRDYGAWLEKRRQALLESTAGQPYFWYSATVTAGMLFIMGAYAKMHLDHRRSLRITAEMMADLYSHDLYSRKAATGAIEKYNRHIELCNRAIESAESIDGGPGLGSKEAEGLKGELQRVAGQLAATTQERNKLQEELRQKSLVVADLSLRLDALSRRADRAGRDGGSANQRQGPAESGNGAQFLGHINRLQEELYAERQKNKRLKGS